MTNPFSNLGKLEVEGVSEVRVRGVKKDPTWFNAGLYDDVEIYNLASSRECFNKHEVIDDFAFMAQDFGDESWVRVTFGVKQGTRKGLLTIKFPTQSLMYSAYGRKSEAEYKKLVDFFSSIGVKVTRENVLDNIKALFNNLKVLEGVRLKIVVGYTGAYVGYMKELSPNPYVVFNAKDEPISKEGDETLGFSDRDAAAGYATTTLKLKKLQAFPEIKFVNPASKPCVVDLTKNVSVRKEPKKITSKDLPF